MPISVTNETRVHYFVDRFFDWQFSRNWFCSERFINQLLRPFDVLESGPCYLLLGVRRPYTRCVGLAHMLV
jgi:hypothetical protein